MSGARAAALAALLCLVAVPADARHRGHRHSGHHHRHFGHHHRHHFHGPRAFVGGFFWDPFFDPRYYPYPVPYPVYAYPAPPPEEPDVRAEHDEDEDTARADVPDDPLRASYGLVQLRGVPEGAAIDLDGRYWLTAQRLDERWLALPHGTHALVVHPRGAEPIARRIEVAAGKTHVVHFPPPPREPR